MSGHKTKIEWTKAEVGYTYEAVCTCRRRSPVVTARQEAEDWSMAHLVEVEKIKARLSGTPSLKVMRDRFEEQASDPGNSDADRAIWRMLADELTARLGDRVDPSEGQGRLW